MRINFVKIEILEVKTGVQVSKNINHFHIALAMPPMQMDINYPLPPMQMDINYPLNIGKISDGKITPGKFSVEKIIKKRKYKPANILQDEPAPTHVEITQ